MGSHVKITARIVEFVAKARSNGHTKPDYIDACVKIYQRATGIDV